MTFFNVIATSRIFFAFNYIFKSLEEYYRVTDWTDCSEVFAHCTALKTIRLSLSLTLSPDTQAHNTIKSIFHIVYIFLLNSHNLVTVFISHTPIINLRTFAHIVSLQRCSPRAMQHSILIFINCLL